MKVKFIRPNRLFAHEVGDVVVLTDADGQTLIHSGHAILADSDASAQPAKRTKKPVDKSKIFSTEIRPDGGPADTTENKLDRNARLAMVDTEREGEADNSEGLEGNADKTDDQKGEEVTAKKEKEAAEKQAKLDKEQAEERAKKAQETATAPPGQVATPPTGQAATASPAQTPEKPKS